MTMSHATTAAGRAPHGPADATLPALPADAPAAARAVFRLLRKLRHGTLDVQLPDGSHARFGDGAEPRAAIRLADWSVCASALKSGDIGFAERYLDGRWTSPDLVALLKVFIANRDAIEQVVYGSWWGSLAYRVKHLLNRNSRRGSRKNIHAHYDIGNPFYRLWLDETMNYSSALFDGDLAQPTADAQRAKVRRALRQLDLQPGQRLLEIGCGWGGLAEIAAKEYGVHVTGITLSREQLEYGQRRMAAAGLSDRVDLRIADYREDIGRFDHMASVEMFEAVGARYWKTFMRSAFRALKPGGRAAMQVITIDEAVFPAYRSGADFIQTYIFPGGILPSEPRLRTSAENAGFRWERAEAFGQHYAETLRQWRVRYDAARQEGRLPPGFDAAFDTIWRYYLMYCEGGFRSGGIDVVQTLLRRP